MRIVEGSTNSICKCFLCVSNVRMHMSATMPSEIWKYYIKIDKTIACCTTCDLIVKSSGNTVNLWNYQERKHNLQRKNQKRKYSATVSSVSSATNDHPDAPSLQEQIINPPSSVVFNTNSAITTSTSTALASMTNPSHTITVTSNSKIRNLTLSESFERTKSFSFLWLHYKNPFSLSKRRNTMSIIISNFSRHYNDNQDFHSEKIPIDKVNYVNFIQQFVYDVPSFSLQYGGGYNTAANIIGPPSSPNYGHFAEILKMRSYKLWWDKAPSRSIDYMPQNNMDIVTQDYANIEYKEAVYPIRISIYELHNPGSVIRIWAQNSNNRWVLLWNGPPQVVHPISRIFSPPLESCDFKTKMLRLEFNYSSLDYYPVIDAVMLMGTSELILPKDQSHKQSITNLLKSINCKHLRHGDYKDYGDIHNLTPDYKYAHLDIIHLLKTLNEHCVIYKSDITANFNKRKPISQLGPLITRYPKRDNSMQHFLSEEPTKFIKDKLSSDKSKKPLHCSFSALSDEMIIKILKYLDLKSLCRISRVNKRFNNLAQDPFLYTRLNLKPYWYNIDTKALHYLAFKCKYLQQLDLSWCDSFSVPDLEKFLDSCGSLLTHLQLNCCSCIDDFAMLKISKTCRNLKELGLRSCDLITDKGFSYLETLEFLECLDLYEANLELNIRTQTLCKILRRNQRMRHLHMGGRNSHVNVDTVAMELKNSCPNLESIDLWKGHTLTSKSIDALAHCKNLREVDFSFCDCSDSFQEFLYSCEHLEKVSLAYFEDLTELDLEALALCTNLKQLDVSGVPSLTMEICDAIFINCCKLEMIDLSFCDCITYSAIRRWQRKYTHIKIKTLKLYYWC